ncbi:MAG: hypothetical protein AAF762_00270 [Pseudomonadota bacterium]
MTDEALAGAAEAAPAPDVAPASQEPRDPAPQPTEEVKAPTIQEALEKAFKDTPDASSDGEPARGPDGRFVAKEGGEPKPAEPSAAQEPAAAKPEADDPPARFSTDAKQAWKDAPGPVKAEIRRAIGEMEKGLTDYRGKIEPLERFFKMAEGSGTTVADALEKYTGFEAAIRKDPIAGLSAVAKNVGLDMQDIARQVLGQQKPADGQPDPRDAAIQQLTQTVQQLQQQIGGVTNTVQTQQAQAIQTQIAEFKASAPHFDQVEADMALMITNNMATDLKDAYEKASRMNGLDPYPKAPQPPQAQTLARLSPTGAPASGSNPATSPPPASSPREALERAFKMTG